MKRYSMLLIFSEMQIKNTIRYHLTLVRMGIIKSLQARNDEEAAEKRELPYTVGRNANIQPL